MDKRDEAEESDFNKPDEPEAPREVNLGPRKFVLVQPTSLAVAADIVELARKSRWRAYAAALAVCIPRLAKLLKVPSLDACEYSMARFGGHVLDALQREGVGMEDLGRAGGTAFAIVAASMVPEREVVAAEVFSAPTKEELTST